MSKIRSSTFSREDLWAYCEKCENAWLDQGQLFCPDCRSKDIVRARAYEEEED